MRYRAEIDGLRAVSIVPVVLFHAGIPAFAGGYVGVDVFFVVSGYLITSILYGQIEARRFSIIDFYERRARRILPALLVVCVATFPFAWLWMMPAEFADYAGSLAATCLFVSNLHFWLGSGYFGAAAEMKPLLHTWSLAVEEQFYILFPLLLLGLRYFKERTRFVVLAALVAASLGIAEIGSRIAPDATFFLLPSRGWELGAGSLAYIATRETEPTPNVQSDLLAAAGLIMILVSVVLFDHETRFPSLWAVLPVGGATLVILFAVEGTLTARLLALRPLVFVGLISYSLYLWHQPLFALARIRSIGEPSVAVYAILILASFLLAYLSWRFVEAPFRNRRRLSRRAVFSASAASFGFLAAIGVSGVAGSGFPWRLPEAAIELAAVGERKSEVPRGCFVGTGSSAFDPEAICAFGDGGETIHLWGDSHAMALAPALGRAFAERGVALDGVLSAGCAPIIGYEWRAKPFNCISKTTAMRDELLARTEPGDVIILHARWTNFISPVQFDNGEGGHERELTTPPVFASRPDLWHEDPDWVPFVSARLQETLAPLIDGGRRILLVYPIPEAGWYVPEVLAREVQFGIERTAPLSTREAVFRKRSEPAYMLLDSLDSDLITRIYPARSLCGARAEDRCEVSSPDGWPYYFDDDHLSADGANLFVDEIVDAGLTGLN
ncbi:MAG: acyltransferase family protein [Pseudomonadota bacterium]